MDKNQNENSDNQLREYIDSQIAAGVTPADVKKALVESGWDIETIETYLPNIHIELSDVPRPRVSKQSIMIIGSLILAIILASPIVWFGVKVIVGDGDAKSSKLSGGIAQTVEECKIQDFTFEDAARDARIQILEGPLDEVWSCSTWKTCQEVWDEQKSSGVYDEAVALFLNKSKEIYDATALLGDWEDFYSENGVHSEEFDLIAKQLLTPETYAIEKTGQFDNFLTFLMLYKELYPSIQSEAKRVEQYTPLTTEELSLLEAEIKRTGMLPDPNDPRFDFLRDKPISISPDLSVTSRNQLSPTFPVVQINDSRIAVIFLEGYMPVIFDLVQIDNCWKIDLIEPYRPDEQTNPRINTFGIGVEFPAFYWGGLEELSTLALLDSPLFQEFKNWWSTADTGTRREFLLRAFPETNLEDISESMLTRIEINFFSNVVPVEVDGTLRYEPVEKRMTELLIRDPFIVSKQNGIWNLESVNQ